MKRMIKFPSIEQFNQIVRNIQHTARFEGVDEDGKVIYNNNDLPILKCIATEKLHGTNGSICYSNINGFWVQSRENIITPEKDNAACAFHAEQNKDAWIDIIKTLANEYDINLDEKIISIYFEWAGGNIQKKSALSGSQDKKAFIFQHFKVSPLIPNEDEKAVWYETSLQEEVENNVDGNWFQKYWIDDTKANIFNIRNFKTYEFTIDFNKPFEAQNEMLKLVEEVIEPASPVGKAFGFENNIGEGVVCFVEFKGQRFVWKIKGEKHSNSKVKTLKKVDSILENKKIDVANKVCKAWRLEQMFDLANDTINGKLPDIKNIGEFLKLLNKDIIKEESHFIAENGFEPKEIFKYTNNIAKKWYQEQLVKSL